MEAASRDRNFRTMPRLKRRTILEAGDRVSSIFRGRLEAIMNRLPRTLPVIFVSLASLATASLFSLSPAVAQQTSAAASSAASGQDKAVAIVGSEALYESDYLPRIQSEVQKIRMEEYQLRRRALEDAVNKRLLKAE